MHFKNMTQLNLIGEGRSAGICSYMTLDVDEYVKKVVIEYSRGIVSAVSFISSKMQLLNVGMSLTTALKDSYDFEENSPLIGF